MIDRIDMNNQSLLKSLSKDKVTLNAKSFFVYSCQLAKILQFASNLLSTVLLYATFTHSHIQCVGNYFAEIEVIAFVTE